MVDESKEYPWYNLKCSIAEFMIPKLEEYREEFIASGVCIPTWVSNDIKEPYSDKDVEILNELWVSDLDKMILAFKMVLNFNTAKDESIPYNESEIQKGIDLFAKYYQNLWD
jgi:hypothetical protein